MRNLRKVFLALLLAFVTTACGTSITGPETDHTPGPGSHTPGPGSHTPGPGS